MTKKIFDTMQRTALLEAVGVTEEEGPPHPRSTTKNLPTFPETHPKRSDKDLLSLLRNAKAYMKMGAKSLPWDKEVANLEYELKRRGVKEEAEDPTAKAPETDEADFPKTIKLLMRFVAKGNEQRAKKTMALVSAHLAKMAQGLGAENEAKMLMKVWKRLRAG